MRQRAFGTGRRAEPRRRAPNPQLAKLHRSYSTAETAELFRVHRNTVRGWIKAGLPTVTGRPVLILGRDLRTWLRAKRTAKKRPCPPGHLFCLRCREPRPAAGNYADFEVDTPTLGNLIAMCAQCETLMYRRTSLTKLKAAAGNLEVQIRKAEGRVVEIK